MQVIDGTWLRSRLSGDHGEQKRLAAAVGITADKITKILKGERTIRAHEIPRFVAYFSTQIEGKGFAESSAIFEPSVAAPIIAPPDILALLMAIAPATRYPSTYKMARNEPGAALLAGDLLLVELGANAAPGDLVLVTKNNTDTDTQATVLRRYIPPFLLALDIAGTRMPESSESSLESAIVAVIKASARAQP